MLFDQIVQESAGNPITLTIRDHVGQERQVKNAVHFVDFFNPPFNIAGIFPRVQVASFTENSVARGPDKLHLGDVIVAVKSTDSLPHPTREMLIDRFNSTGRRISQSTSRCCGRGRKLSFPTSRRPSKFPTKMKIATAWAWR